jgi:hypothetical protein
MTKNYDDYQEDEELPSGIGGWGYDGAIGR